MKIANSSNIGGVSYNAKRKVLTVDFLIGTSYKYTDVPAGVFKAFKIANKKKESVGSLFHTLVKGKFTAKKVEKVMK
jgi:hypothetical protein